MPAAGQDQVPATRRLLPATASAAIAGTLQAAPRQWRLLGASARAWWCAAEEQVLVITDERAMRLPNAVVLPLGCLSGRAGPEPGAKVTIGAAAVDAGLRTWRVVRWWDPRVASVATERHAVARVVGMARGQVTEEDRELFAALCAGSVARVVGVAEGMIGRGPGLTPEGDDRLLGAIVGYRHVAASTGLEAGSELVDAMRHPVLRIARTSTTFLSYTLLRHAFDRDVAAPVGALLRALTGRGDPVAASAATAAIGSSSGPALLGGVLAGAAAACGVSL